MYTASFLRLFPPVEFPKLSAYFLRLKRILGKESRFHGSGICRWFLDRPGSEIPRREVLDRRGTARQNSSVDISTNYKFSSATLPFATSPPRTAATIPHTTIISIKAIPSLIPNLLNFRVFGQIDNIGKSLRAYWIKIVNKPSRKS